MNDSEAMNTRYSFLLLVAGAFLLTGCFEEVSGPYDGPDRVAFSQVNGAFSTVVPDEAGTIEIPAQLIGPQRANSFDVSVSVQEDTSFRVREVPVGDGSFEEERDIRALPTTAPDDAYSVPGSLEFPADSSNVTLGVTIQDAFEASAPSGTTTRLTLRLEPNPDANIEVAENWRFFEIVVQQP
jgi:hypothetical protein